MGNLGLRARDEEAEEIRRHVLLARAQRSERVEQVVLDDPLRPSEPIEPLDREVVRTLVLCRAPEPLQHELQERSLDTPAVRRLCVCASAVPHERDAARRRRVDHPLDETGPELVRRLRGRQAAVPLAQRPLDRVAGRFAREVLDAHVVREEARDASLEAVELRERVLADREQDVDPQVRIVDDRRKLARERASAVLLGVVEEVVLELVEDDEQRAYLLRPRPQRLDRGLALMPRGQLVAPHCLGSRGPNRLHQRRKRPVAPAREGAHREGPARAKLVFRLSAPVIDDPLIIPRGTTVANQAIGSEVEAPFQTEDELVLHPAPLRACLAAQGSGVYSPVNLPYQGNGGYQIFGEGEPRPGDFFYLVYDTTDPGI